MSLGLAQASDVSVIYGKYGPTGRIEDSAPNLSWKLTPTGGGKITHVRLTLNDQPVPAVFVAASSSVEYQPAAPLRSGLYTVHCQATVDRQLVVRQDWSFEIAGKDGGGPAGFAVGPVLDSLNELRRVSGLPPFALDSRMSAAAAAHSHYQAINRTTGHFEDPSLAGFTGKAPWDRTAAFGVPGGCYECVCGNESDPRKAIQLLFDAPYHRIPFLQSGSPKVGIGMEAGALTIDCALSSESGVGLSPAPGQSGASRAWDGNEFPSPLRIHGATGPVGYPIVFAWLTPQMEGLAVRSMRLLDGKVVVPTYLNTPENDSELRFAAILLPKAALKPETTYTVEVKASTAGGRDLSRTWSFRTGS